MSYGLGYQAQAPSGTATKTPSTQETDSSSLRWSGIAPGEPWSPSWSRPATDPTAAPSLPMPLMPPPEPESEVPWGAIAVGVALIAAAGGVFVFTRPRRAPTPNRRRRRRRRR